MDTGGWFKSDKPHESVLCYTDNERQLCNVAFYYPSKEDCTYSQSYDLPNKDIKPFLRRLTDMSTEELKLWRKASEIEIKHGDSVIQQNANSTAYLLSIFIDLFGLIDSGLAIETVSER